MAEAARTVRHHVSDCLAERFPYDARKGFAGIRQREMGRVFNGHGVVGMDDLINSLTDPSMTAEEKAKAAHHLYSRSASQEAKVEMLQKGIVPILVSTLNTAEQLLLLHECLLLLRSFAVLPQGCYALIHQGAVPAVLRALHTSDTATPITPMTPTVAPGAVECRAAAAHVLAQIVSNASGLRWLLGVPHDSSMGRLPGIDSSDVPPAVTAETLVQEVVNVLAALQEDWQRSPSAPPAATGTDNNISKTVMHLFQFLAHVTTLPRGVEAFLHVPDGVPVLSAYLKCLSLLLCGAASAVAAAEAPLLVEAVLECVWNVALTEAGGAALEKEGIPPLLFDIFAGVCKGSLQAVPVSTQRQLTGALSAVSRLTSVKVAGTRAASTAENGGDTESRIDLLVRYLRDWNAAIETQYLMVEKPVPSAVAALVKNAVQCVRLASEHKPVRDATHAIMTAMESSDPHEVFFFRRQLYFHTKWEAEFHAGDEAQ